MSAGAQLEPLGAHRHRLEGDSGRRVGLRAGVLTATGGVLALGALALGGPPLVATAVLAIALAMAILGGRIFSWNAQIGIVLAVVLLVPIRRFGLPADLPFELEPYRVLVALLALAWASSLLVDERVRLCRSGLEAPIVAFAIALVASIAANPGLDGGLQDEVAKSFTFFASFFVLFYVVVSLVQGRRSTDTMLAILVFSGAVVAFFTLIEARNGWNAFDQLDRVIPVLKSTEEIVAEDRGGRLRVVGSAQHPIALGAALVMLLPLALYLARAGSRRLIRWSSWPAFALVALAALATISRTAVLMLLTTLLVFLILRPAKTLKAVAIGLIPAVIAVHLALPGAIGALRQAFFPEGGLVAEQATGVGNRGQGRVADLAPALQEFGENPLFGQGFATRITDEGRANADILDNQWLELLVETGIFGVAAFAWLIVAALVIFMRSARTDHGARGLLLTGIAASTASFAVGMFFFDAFSFIQVSLLFFVFLGLGISAARPESHTDAWSVHTPHRGDASAIAAEPRNASAGDWRAEDA